MASNSNPVPGIAVFDLDGTITRSDTLGPYVLGFIKSRPLRMLGLPRVLPMVARYAMGRADEGELKSCFIRSTLGGATRAAIDARTSAFIPRLLAHGLFKAALARIAEHRSQGAYLVLMSASTDLYVPAVGRALGFDEIICTGVRWDGEYLNGSLTTPNRRGEEKARCFNILRDQHPGTSTVAYGNAASDLPHLRLADHGVLVNGSSSARSAAARDGISCVDWR